MNLGRGFPVPHDGDFWVPATPEKTVVRTTNYTQPEMQQNQTAQERWHDLLGMYTGLLQESSSGPLTKPSHNIHAAVSPNLHQQGVISPNVYQHGVILPHLLHNGVNYPNPHHNRIDSPSLRQIGLVSPNLRENGIISSNFRDPNRQYLKMNAGITGSEVQKLARSMAPQKVNSLAELLGTMTSPPVTNGQSNRSIYIAEKQTNMRSQSQGFESNQTPYKFGSPLLQQNRIVHGNCSIGDYNLPQTTNMRPSRPEYNLNFPPRSEDFESSSALTLLNQLWPAAPDQEKQPNSHQTIREQVSRAEEIPNQNKEVQANGIVSQQPDIVEENSNEFQTTAGASISTPSKEKKIFDGGNEVIDLNKEPSQKTSKRKKHRPRVVKEGNPKKTPKKPDAAKDTPDGKPREKRKYVRRKGIETSKTPCTDIAKEGGVCNVEPVAKTSRRSLNFDTENGSKKRSQSGDIDCQPREKRKYVRRKGVDTSKTPCIDTVKEVEVCHVEPAAKTCRRSLNFDAENRSQSRGFDCQAQNNVRNKVPFDLNLAANNSECSAETNTHSTLASKEPQNILEQQTDSLYKSVHSVEQTLGGSVPFTAQPLAPRNHALNAIARSLSFRNANLNPSDGKNWCNPVHDCLTGIGQIDFENLSGGRQMIVQSKLPQVGSSSYITGSQRDNSSIEVNQAQSVTLMSCQVFSNENAKKGGYMGRSSTMRQNCSEDIKKMRIEDKKCGNSSSLISEITIVGDNSGLSIKKRDHNVQVQSSTICKSSNSEANKAAYDWYFYSPDSRYKLHEQNTSSEVHQPDKRYTWNKSHHPVSKRKKKKVSAVDDVEKVFTVDDITDWLVNLSVSTGKKIFGEEENALVPYVGDRAIVAHKAFDPIKRRVPRPRVDLDPETNRLWNLLMGKEGNESAEAVDIDKQKWWEEERKVLRGRADTFIHRMHQVQGNRRFSKWKGSVVDSVVGVFLTQNVSDHLSSSAFMALAAKFPLKSRTDKPECSRNREHNQVRVTFPDETIDDYVSLLVNGHSRTEEDIISSQSSSEFFIYQASEDIRSSSGSNLETEEQLMGRNFNLNHFPDTVSEQAQRAVACSQRQFGATTSSYLESSLYGQHAGVTSGKNANSHPLTSNSLSTDIPSAGSWLSMLMDPEISVREDMSSFGSVDFGSTTETSYTAEQTANPTPNETTHFPEGQSSKIGNATQTGKKRKAEEVKVKWDILREQVESENGPRGMNVNAMDSLDYEALRNADVEQISDAIKERGMNNMLAERIKAFLNRLVEDHGKVDLEWLRDVQPDKGKDYLLSIWGLGLKSVECVRLLTLHHLAFPVDTNVGRIAVRLGWVPLQPLPESLQLHLLEMYPVLESIQKYLWPRLCKMDQETLYELHYQMITFGKVFCTKREPNCNACPMRGECRHFASAFASARLALPGAEEKRIVLSTNQRNPKKLSDMPIKPMPLLQTWDDSEREREIGFGRNDEPIIEEPTTPEPPTEVLERDIEDAFYEDPDEIPVIKLNLQEFTSNLQNFMQENMEMEEFDVSRALVALSPEFASIPMPKLKHVSRLRTEHRVYVLPDSHPLLKGMDRREPDDPSPYLLAIWTPGETADSVQPPESKCSSLEGGPCNLTTCFSCNSAREAHTQTVRGTILIPCRTAMRGSFPLNGTYFQVNELFADHESSLNPIDVPRSWLWPLERRTVFFGTSVSTICKGLSTENIQFTFRKGFVCVRGFDRETRSPRPLRARLHFPASMLVKQNEQRKSRAEVKQNEQRKSRAAVKPNEKRKSRAAVKPNEKRKSRAAKKV